MRKRRLNQPLLLKELRKLLILPDTVIHLRKFKDLHGHSAWDWSTNDISNEIEPSKIRIHVDPRRDSRVSVVIHELLHVYLHKLIQLDSKMTEPLEEAVILGLEKELFSYLSRPNNLKLLESWHNAVERKLS
jgi:hypothetical protein